MDTNMRGCPVRRLLVLLLLPALLLPAAVASAAEEGGGSPLLPALAAAGWRTAGEVRRFSPETLYEEIDGEAELFLPFGFRSLAVAILVSERHPGAELRVEEYLHGSPKEAFGIYGQHRYEGQETALLDGAEAAVSDASADFFRGERYVRIRLAAGALPRATLLAAAREAARSLPGTVAPPPGVPLLLGAGAVPGTLLWQPRALAGYEVLAPGYEGRLPASAGVEGKALFLEGEPEGVARRLASLPGWRPGEPGSAARERWRADLPGGTLYLRPRDGGLAGVITRDPPAAAGAFLDRLAPAAPPAQAPHPPPPPAPGAAPGGGGVRLPFAPDEGELPPLLFGGGC